MTSPSTLTRDEAIAAAAILGAACSGVCFFSELTDLSVDGEHLVRPVTPWSPPQDSRLSS